MAGKGALPAVLLPALLWGCCTPQRLPNPYADGALRHPAYVQITGMPTELAEIAQAGLARGWKTVCTGSAGEESTLRLELPAGTKEADIHAYFADFSNPHGSSSQMIYHGTKMDRGCDSEPQMVTTLPAPPGYEGPRADPRVLTIGPEAELRRLAGSAALCGIKDPVVRPFRDSDITPRPDFVTADSHSLVSSESLADHPGPALCFLKKMTATRAPAAAPGG